MSPERTFRSVLVFCVFVCVWVRAIYSTHLNFTPIFIKFSLYFFIENNLHSGYNHFFLLTIVVNAFSSFYLINLSRSLSILFIFPKYQFLCCFSLLYLCLPFHFGFIAAFFFHLFSSTNCYYIYISEVECLFLSASLLY